MDLSRPATHRRESVGSIVSSMPKPAALLSALLASYAQPRYVSRSLYSGDSSSSSPPSSASTSAIRMGTFPWTTPQTTGFVMVS
jgi:hypothetical protein